MQKPIKIILHGAAGKLNRAIREIACKNIHITAGVDVELDCSAEFPMYRHINDVGGDINADVVIDCSYHATVEDMLSYAFMRSMPVVIATTGHTEAEYALINEAAEKIPVFMSANMSMGVFLLAELANMASVLLPDFDVEIIETHHNQKKDAPSGTALLLRDSISDNKDAPIHSIRGGGIVGEHEVILAGEHEVIRLSHSAISRKVFAQGALAAAHFIVNKPPGIYSMKDLIRGDIR
ncbi:MAG: 4-hydroxy-tetrahydrodipicolinate reductase [Defluviitaleaceae bacterium]|nr:4-hydroxy-tetrahydrodipicolinate reductase [Defluviitaleaceae bacterium]